MALGMAASSENITSEAPMEAASLGGRNPNAMYATMLQNCIDKFCTESHERHFKTQPTLRDLLDNTTESTFDAFIDTLNASQSTINKDCINKIGKVFGYVQSINESTQAIPGNLNRLFGILRCTLILGHKICKGKRLVAERLESMGMWMRDVKADEVESIIVIWDLLAQYAIAVVQFCTSIICLTTPIEVLLLGDKLPDIQHVNGLIQEKKETYRQELAEQEDRRHLRLAAETEADKKKEEEANSMKNWLEVNCQNINQSRHETLSAAREPSTGEWFIRNVESWLESDEHPVLWAAGSPGVGKSILASALVDHYLASTKPVGSPPQPSGAEKVIANEKVDISPVKHIAYVYFAYDEQKDQTPSPVYAHLLRQLYPSCGSLHVSLDKVRNKPECAKPTSKEFIEGLESILRKLPRNVLLVFDALDEANAEMQSRFKSWIKSLPQKSPRIVLLARADVQRPYTSSRRVPALIRSLNIKASSIDMKKFIKGQLGRDEDVMRIIKKTLRKKQVEPWIETQAGVMLRRASNMFLLVSLQIRNVCSKRTVREMEEAANKGSNDPNAIYSKTWDQITAVGNSELPRRVIGLLTFAKRTLSAEELTTALSTRPSVYFIDAKNKHFPEDLEAACRGLVVIDRQTSAQRLRLAHQTVQEYFSRTPDFQAMQREFCNICFTYLITVLRPLHPNEESLDSDSDGEDDEGSRSSSEHDRGSWSSDSILENPAQALTFDDDVSETEAISGKEDTSDDDSFISSSSYGDQLFDLTNLCTWLSTTNPMKYPLLRYAGEYATEHLKMISCDEQATRILSDFINSAFSTRRQNTMDLQLKSSPRPPRRMTRLHLAALLGNQSVVETVLGDDPVALQSSDDLGQTPLVYALLYGAQRVARLLLEKGADVNALDSEGNSVLIYCTETTSEDIIGRIVDKTDAQHIKPRTLQLAIFFGNLPLVKAVLDREVITIPCQGTASNRDEGWNDDTFPLNLAIERGYDKIATELLKRGMDSERTDSDGRTPLMLAIICAQHEVVDRLISMHVDVHKLDADSNTALHFAVLVNATLVRKLVDAGANTHLLNKNGQTPLALALDEKSDVSTTELRNILEALSVDRNMILFPSSATNTTALHIAARQSNTKAFKLFMNILGEIGKATINGLDETGCSPLMICIQNKVSFFVDFLLENFFDLLDFTVQLSNGNSYLQQAIACSNTLRIVVRLIEVAPQLVNLDIHSGESPLAAAVSNQDMAAFRALISHNARCRDDYEFRWVIRLALERKEVELTKTLMTLRDQSTSWSDEDATALVFSAVAGGSTELLDLMLSMISVGADCHNRHGETLIQQAILAGHVSILGKLIVAGFHINALTNAGKSALDFALEKGDATLIKDLVENGGNPGLEWRELGTSIQRWSREPWFPQLVTALKASVAALWVGIRPEVDDKWHVQHKSHSEEVAVDQHDDQVPYVEVVVPLGGNFPVRRIKFTTDSHDQGWSHESSMYGGSYLHSWTWFEAAVLKQDQSSVSRRTIQVNLHADREYRTHVNQWDFRDTSPGVREWLGSIQSGDTIQVYPRALYQGWRNHVRSIEVIVYCDIPQAGKLE